MSALTEAGARYACETMEREVDGATSILFMLADRIASVSEEDAGSEKALWVESITFVARSLLESKSVTDGWIATLPEASETGR